MQPHQHPRIFNPSSQWEISYIGKIEHRLKTFTTNILQSMRRHFVVSTDGSVNGKFEGQRFGFSPDLRKHFLDNHFKSSFKITHRNVFTNNKTFDLVELVAVCRIICITTEHTSW